MGVSTLSLLLVATDSLRTELALPSLTLDAVVGTVDASFLCLTGLRFSSDPSTFTVGLSTDTAFFVTDAVALAGVEMLPDVELVDAPSVTARKAVRIESSCRFRDKRRLR